MRPWFLIELKPPKSFSLIEKVYPSYLTCFFNHSWRHRNVPCVFHAVIVKQTKQANTVVDSNPMEEPSRQMANWARRESRLCIPAWLLTRSELALRRRGRASVEGSVIPGSTWETECSSPWRQRWSNNKWSTPGKFSVSFSERGKIDTFVCRFWQTVKH